MFFLIHFHLDTLSSARHPRGPADVYAEKNMFDPYSETVLSSHSKIDKTKVLKTSGSLGQVKSIAAFCIKQLSALKTFLGLFIERSLKTGCTV